MFSSWIVSHSPTVLGSGIGWVTLQIYLIILRLKKSEEDDFYNSPIYFPRVTYKDETSETDVYRIVDHKPYNMFP